MLKFAIPVLHISDSAAAEHFYGLPGFQRRFAYRLDEAKREPCYMGLARDGVWLTSGERRPRWLRQFCRSYPAPFWRERCGCLRK